MAVEESVRHGRILSTPLLPVFPKGMRYSSFRCCLASADDKSVLQQRPIAKLSVLQTVMSCFYDHHMSMISYREQHSQLANFHADMHFMHEKHMVDHLIISLYIIV